MSQKISNPCTSQFEQVKRRILRKFTSTVKLFLGEDISRMILSFTIALLLIGLYYFQETLNLGWPPIEKEKALFVIVITPLLNIPIFSRARHTRRMLRRLEDLGQERIHLDSLFEIIFLIYRKQGYFHKKVEHDLLQNKDHTKMVNTIHRRSKLQIPTALVLSMAFSLLFIFILADPILKIYAGCMGVISSVFEFLNYKRSSKWLKIYDELNHWGEFWENTDNLGEIPMSATLTLLEEDFYFYDSENLNESEGKGKVEGRK